MMDHDGSSFSPFLNGHKLAGDDYDAIATVVAKEPGSFKSQPIQGTWLNLFSSGKFPPYLERTWQVSHQDVNI